MVSKRWSWLAGLALLFAGLTNAHSHVHYCFDGQEPPASVHIVNSTDHEHELPGHDDGDEHDDLDLDVPNQALAKVVKHDLPAIDALAWTLPIEAAPRGGLAVGIDAEAQPNPRYALPQLRAPPR
jgi:hypothetical protein